MQRYGFNLKIIFLIISLFAILGCAPTKYNDHDMIPLTTLSRIVMDIVKSYYIETPLPKEINENEIKAIIAMRGKTLDAIDQLNKYDIKIVSNGTNLAAIFWDPKNGRKLIEDFQCTNKVDFKAWKEEMYGSDLTLDWGVCR